MAIIYLCKKCGKKFKVREYSQLTVIYIKDVKNNTSTITGRVCDSCGYNIDVDDKIVSI